MQGLKSIMKNRWIIYIYTLINSFYIVRVPWSWKIKEQRATHNKSVHYICQAGHLTPIISYPFYGLNRI